MILVVLSEGGCWWTLSALRKCGGDKLQREWVGGGGVGSKTGEEMEEDRKTTDLPAVREGERPKDSALSREMPMIQSALVSTA